MRERVKLNGVHAVFHRPHPERTTDKGAVKSVGELKQAFEDSVDDYLKWCEEDGVSPEKPFSGRLNLRLSPETHKKPPSRRR